MGMMVLEKLHKSHIVDNSTTAQPDERKYGGEVANQKQTGKKGPLLTMLSTM